MARTVSVSSMRLETHVVDAFVRDKRTTFAIELECQSITKKKTMPRLIDEYIDTASSLLATLTSAFLRRASSSIVMSAEVRRPPPCVGFDVFMQPVICFRYWLVRLRVSPIVFTCVSHLYFSRQLKHRPVFTHTHHRDNDEKETSSVVRA